MTVREEQKTRKLPESESESEREGATRVVKNKTYSAVLKEKDNLTTRKVRTPWKSPEHKRPTIETRVSLNEGMGEGKSVKKVVIEKLNSTNVGVVDGL